MNVKRCQQCDTTHDGWKEKFCPSCGSTLVDHHVMCNLCGLSCVLGCHSMVDNHGLLNQVVSGGYESTPGNGHGALDDGTTYTFSLCEFCLDWLFEQFQLPPKVGTYMGLDVDDYRPAADRVVNDEWRKLKREFFEERDRRSAARNKK